MGFMSRGRKLGMYIPQACICVLVEFLVVKPKPCLRSFGFGFGFGTGRGFGLDWNDSADSPCRIECWRKIVGYET